MAIGKKALEKERGATGKTARKAPGGAGSSGTSRRSKKPSGGPSPAKAANGKVAGIGDEAVRKATGCGWEEWFAHLDTARMRERDHKEIAGWLGEEHPGLSGWWVQMVTVAYEQARGLREKHQKRSGYSASASKTVSVGIDELYAVWADARKRRKWLGDAKLTVRKATPAKSMRITWEADGSSVNVYFWDKGAAKSQVQVEHEKLASAGDVAAKKELWKGAFARLAAHLGA